MFPLDINESKYKDLMRIPGIGHLSATRIVKLQNQGVRITKTKQLKTTGVVLKRALPFITIGDKTQLTLEDFTKNKGT